MEEKKKNEQNFNNSEKEISQKNDLMKSAISQSSSTVEQIQKDKVNKHVASNVSKKSKKAASVDKTVDESLKCENYLCGIIVADINERSFEPISREIPKVLLQLNGCPFLNYSFEFLCKNGVKDVYILAKPRNALSIQTHVKKYLERKKDKSFTVQLLTLSESVSSVGDALRELDSLKDIIHDFILMLGDSFSVADIRPAIYDHKKRNQTNSDAILTKIFACAHPSNSILQKSDDAVVVYDNETCELVAYERFFKATSSIFLQNRILQGKNRDRRVRVRYDLQDPFIFICSPKVLKLFSESFDYTDINEDFIYNIINKELKLEEIYVHILSLGSCGFNQYAARVADPRSYLAIATDMLERWTYPIVADSHSIQDQSCYVHAGGSVYISNSVSTGLKTNLHKQVVIDDFTFIDDGATIQHSIIGKSCKIGKNSLIEGAIIFDEVEIEDNVQVFHSLISKNVKIRSGSIVNRGCIIGSGVIIDKLCNVPAYSRLSLFIQEKEKKEEEYRVDDKKEDDVSLKSDLQSEMSKNNTIDLNVVAKLSCREIVGEEGRGILWTPTVSENELKSESLGESILDEITLVMPNIDICETENETFHREEENENAEKNIKEENEKESYDTEKIKALLLNESDEFLSETQEMAAEGITDYAHIHHKVLEIKSFRLSSNKSEFDVIKAIFPVILDFLSSLDCNKNVWSEKVKLHRIDFFLNSFINCSDSQEKSTCFLLYDCLLSFSRTEKLKFFSTKQNPFYRSENFSFLCELINSVDLISLQYIPKWHSTVCEASDEDQKYLSNARFKAFVEWIDEEDSESD